MSGYRYDTSKIPTQQNQKYLKMKQGAIVVATSPKMTPTSKFIVVKFHWFREHVGKAFEIDKIP